MARHKILSTKPLTASVRAMAAEKNIEVIEKAFISTRTVLTGATSRQIEKAVIEKGLAVAFTSARAVEAAGSEVNTIPEWKIFCLSGKTREAIEKKGWKDLIVETADDAASLSGVIIRHGVRKIVFFCGNKRRDTLPVKLGEAGILMEEIVVYENNAIPCLFDEPVEGILFFSPSAVESFFSVNRITKEVTCFAIGEATAGALKQFTSNRIETCNKPGQEELMELVIQTVTGQP